MKQTTTHLIDRIDERIISIQEHMIHMADTVILLKDLKAHLKEGTKRKKKMQIIEKEGVVPADAYLEGIAARNESGSPIPLESFPTKPVFRSPIEKAPVDSPVIADGNVGMTNGLFIPDERDHKATQRAKAAWPFPRNKE